MNRFRDWVVLLGLLVPAAALAQESVKVEGSEVTFPTTVTASWAMPTRPSS